MVESVWNRYSHDDVVVIGINRGETRSTVINFRNAFGLEFPVLMDPNGGAYADYFQFGGFTPFPIDYVID